MSLSRCSWKFPMQLANGRINYCQVRQWTRAQMAIGCLLGRSDRGTALAAQGCSLGEGLQRPRAPHRGTTTTTGRGKGPRTAPRRAPAAPGPSLTQVVRVGAVGEDGQESEDGGELAVGQLRGHGVRLRRPPARPAGRALRAYRPGRAVGAGPGPGPGSGPRLGRSGLTSRTAGMSSSSPKT